MAGGVGAKTLTDASALWQELRKSGVSIQTKSGRDGYDAALVAEIKCALFPGSSRSLERELKEVGTTTEAFLEVFFRAIQPFSMMLADILAMFEEANAKRSDNNLKISFQFDKASPALAMALDAFREVTGSVRRITRPVVRRLWNGNMLSLLHHSAEKCLEEFNLERPSYFQQSARGTSVISGTAVEEWCHRHARRTWVKFPGFSRASNPDFAAVISQCETLIHAIIDACMEFGPGYDDLSRSFMVERDMTDAPEDARMRSVFRHHSREFWANSFASLVEAVILYVEALPMAERDKASLRAAEILADILDHVPAIPGVEETVERSFLDLINFPVWQRRHEVYAVWVGSRIMRALPDHCRDWHPDGDTLRFPFSGAHLATLESALGDVQFWTEMRTSLDGATGVFGRKAIQPDFRLVSVPLHRNDATILVVECKQYKRGVSSWFAGALDDYSLGCPGASVVLVNYGDIPGGTLARVDASRQDRCHVIAKMRPDHPEALAHFDDIVRESVPVRTPIIMPKVSEEFAFGFLYKIVAKWGYQHSDIDLHMVVTDKDSGQRAFVDYSSQGEDLSFPWACLLKDIQAPPGGETITFRRVARAEYDIFVNIFNGRKGSAPGSISVEIEGSSGTAVLKWPAGRPGGCWYVCWFDEEGIVHVVDRVYDELPPHAMRLEAPERMPTRGR
jgi:hypothetical protein